MENRASQARDLSRSGQPGRRLARRRQHLPNPVHRRHRVPSVFEEFASDDLIEVLTIPARTDLFNRIVIEPGLEFEVDTVG